MSKGELKRKRLIVKAKEANVAEIAGYVLLGVAFIVLLGSVGTIEITEGAIPKKSLIAMAISGVYIVAYVLFVLRGKEFEW